MEKKDEFVDFHIDMLDSPDEGVVSAAIMCLGIMAAAHIRQTGLCAMLLKEDGKVYPVNPLQVYFNPDIVEEASGEMRYVRPVVTDGKPKFVAMRHGKLWEVAFDDRQDQKTQKPEGEGL